MTRNKSLPECHDCRYRYAQHNAMFCPHFYDPSRNEESDVFRPVQPDGSRLCSVLSSKVRTHEGVIVEQKQVMLL
jgi:hypothetical protein